MTQESKEIFLQQLIIFKSYLHDSNKHPQLKDYYKYSHENKRENTNTTCSEFLYS
ncbi:hypothetical protein HanIR_Chr06g0284841 [Helianthus annuus]|nr:hypothetical protein HanIR_Chr06g0284841 [Helianthus annuus]